MHVLDLGDPSSPNARKHTLFKHFCSTLSVNILHSAVDKAIFQKAIK